MSERLLRPTTAFKIRNPHVTMTLTRSHGSQTTGRFTLLVAIPRRVNGRFPRRM
jgi:hypothetical protein